MPTLKDLDKKLQQLEKNLVAAAPRIITEYAADYAALAVREIQTEGVEGAQYSTKPMLATASMFNRKSQFKPTEVATTLGRDEEGKLIKGGARTKKGNVKKSSTEARFKWVKFPGASKAVPVMELEGGYKELRSLNGLQTGHVDLTFSGRELQNIKVLRSDQNSLKFTASIGATNEENKKKLSGQHQRYGNFLKVKPADLLLLDRKAVDQFTKVVTDTLSK
jgi:hypothetical protein